VLSGVGLIARVREETVVGKLALTGTVADYQWALGIIPVTLVIALVLFKFLRETYPDQT